MNPTNPLSLAAQAMGRKGGLAKGPRKARKLTAEHIQAMQAGRIKAKSGKATRITD